MFLELAVGVLVLLGILIGGLVLEAIYKKNKVKHIPGPPRHLVLGSYPFTFEETEKLLEEQKKYGGIYRADFGTQGAVMVVDPALIKEVYMQGRELFPNRPLLSKNPYVIIGPNILTKRDKDWSDLRKSLNPSFTYSSVAKYTGDMELHADRLMEVLISKKKEAINLSDLFYRTTADVISSSAFGFNLNSVAAPESDIVHAITELLAPRPLVGAIPFFHLVPIPSNTSLLRSVKVVRNVIQKMINTRHKSEEPPKDILQLLIESKENLSAIHFGDNDIINESLTFFIAGHETTSNTLSWLMVNLATHPDIQQKVIDEIKEKIGSHGEISYDSVKKLEYLGMCIDETLRLYPTAVLITREAKQDTVLGGYDIKKGTPIICNFNLVHLNEKYWSDPFKFDPERFSEENQKKQVPFSYVPFGAGGHICIGQKFALVEARIIAAKILQQFKVTLAGPVPARHSFIVTRPTTPVMVNLTPLPEN